MAQDRYQKGTSIVVYAEFTDPDDDDAAIDPSTRTLKVKAPDGTSSTIDSGSITNPTVGRYEYVLALTQEGTYRWLWTGSTGIRTIAIPGSCDSEDRTGL